MASTGQNNAASKRRICTSVILLLLFDLIFMYLSKYSHKNLSIMEFNPRSTGNLLNFLFTVLPVLGFLFLIFYPGKIDIKKLYGLLSITIVMNIPLVFTLFIKEFNLPLPFKYLFGYPLENIYVALMFSIYQFLLFFLTAAAWMSIFRINKFLYLRSLLYSLFIIFVLVLGAFVYENEYEDNSEKYFKDGSQADVAVILGAAVYSKNRPSPIFASRIGKANNLYNAGIVRKLLVTGGSAPGEMSEAEVAYVYLVRYGVDPDNIWIERRTSSTSEQIEYIKETLIEKRGLKKIIIVSDQFHLKRAMEMCDFYNIKADGVASGLRLSLEKLFFYKFRDSLALLLFWLFAL
ncbi:MAG: YdcF family protein [Ignavibacteria bacterium]|jgi:vancomycin permeability regulator SanA|nr:YdcF family protein [Ignavibacteria bacterium]MCU7501652.1 YdcF family protein [Ignavibacteria bacterium]MCU7517759.1 YdcF family protein [Ignavibacteria bacterium]